MAIVDDRGRLFGRVNILDAAVGVVVLLLIPLAYGAYLLFRTPAVRLTGVEPARVTQGTPEVTLHGEHLRPYLDATVGGQEATYLFQSPSAAVLKLPPTLAPGTHPVVIFDEGQTLATLADALVVASPLVPVAAIGAPDPHPEVIALGGFRGLERVAATSLARDLATAAGRPAPWGHVIGALPIRINVRYLEPAAVLVTDQRFEVPAVLQLRCKIADAQCRIGDTVLSPTVTVPVTIGRKTLRFTVDEIDPIPSGWATVTLRSTLADTLVQELRQPPADEAALRRTLGAVRAIVQSMAPLFAYPDSSQAVTVALRVPVVRTSEGWLYRGKPLRIGQSFNVDNAQYDFVGTIIAIDGHAVPPIER